MYVLTNIEAEVTSKVLKNAGPSIENGLPEPERKTLRNLIERLSTDIENGLPEQPVTPGQPLPTPPVGPDQGLPPVTTRPGIDNSLPDAPLGSPDNELPETPEPK